MIALEIGNTKTSIGLFQGPELLARWRLETRATATTDDHHLTLTTLLQSAGTTIRQAGPIVLASVVPSATGAWSGLAKAVDVHVVSWRSPLSFEIAIPSPDTLGADRIVSLEAAVRKYGAPCLVVDTGTATTVSVVDPQLRFIGGAIAPGIGISVEALFARAAKLTPITLGAPEQAIGNTTEKALESGVGYGFASLVDGLVSRVRAELQAPKAKVIVSGGAAEAIAPLLPTDFILDRTLALDGLSYVHDNLRKRIGHA